MESGIAAGLGALGFWLFIGSIVVAGIWYDARKKQAQQETLRHLIDSGQNLDDATIDKVMGASDRVDRDLKVAGLITLFIAPGLLILAFAIGMIATEAFWPIMGAAALVGFISAGLLVASKVASRWYEDN